MLQDRVRESIRNYMTGLGSKAFYVRVHPSGGRTYKVKIWIEKDTLDLLTTNKTELKEILQALGELEKELNIKIKEEFKPLK
jgi:hypothetical protein